MGSKKDFFNLDALCRQMKRSKASMDTSYKVRMMPWNQVVMVNTTIVSEKIINSLRDQANEDIDREKLTKKSIR